MAQISFNAKALGTVRHEPNRDVSHAVVRGSHEALVFSRSGIDAIKEGLRLANIQGFNAASPDLPAGDVDS